MNFSWYKFSLLKGDHENSKTNYSSNQYPVYSSILSALWPVCEFWHISTFPVWELGHMS